MLVGNYWIMDSRYQKLQMAVDGYQQTGVPLIAYNGNQLNPAGFSDDVGIYYFIPKLADITGLPLDTSAELFFLGMAVTALIFGILGSLLVFKNWTGKGIAIFALSLVLAISYRKGDVYLISSAIIVAIVPLFLYLFKTNTKIKAFHFLFLFLAGVSIGNAHFIRSHSGTSVLLFIGIILITYLKEDRKKKLQLITVLCVGVMLPFIFFNYTIAKRDAYLSQNQPGYKKVVAKHPFWHSVYIGFGFLNNDLDIKWDDSVAMEKVRSVSPDATYLSPEYESILRREVIRIAIDRPHFLLRNIFAKIGILLFYFLVFANIGIIGMLKYPIKGPVDWAFWAALAFNSSFGILVIPYLEYLLGFISLAAIYGVLYINRIVDMGLISKD